MNTHDELPEVKFKSSADDFIVDEIDAYESCGEGEHTFVRIRKTGVNSDQALKVDPRGCGYAGMKDRESVSTQRLSFHGTTPEAAMAVGDSLEGIVVIDAIRHKNKLKTGHLRGNRFTIRLREIPTGHADSIARGLEQIRTRGAPNAFGPQRFGRDGDNAERALSFVRGETRPPRDARERRLLFSALQSRWFNEVLAARVAEGTFDQPQLGDLLQKQMSGGLFLCTDVETDRARALAHEVSPTGPMFGSKMQPPGEPIASRERDALVRDAITDDQLRAHRDLGEGTRRPLRLLVGELTFAWEDEATTLCVHMSLPPGGYATTVLGQVARLREPLRARGAAASDDVSADGPTGTDGVEGAETATVNAD